MTLASSTHSEDVALGMRVTTDRRRIAQEISGPQIWTIWRQIGRQRHSMFTTPNETLLGTYYVGYATFIEADRAIEKEGLTIKPPKHGATVKHPLMTILNQSRAALLKLAGELGLTPARWDRLDWCVGQIGDFNR